MDSLRTATFVLSGAVAILAWLAYRRRDHYGPMAAYLVWMAGSDWLRVGLRVLLDGADRPFEGLARVSFHADQLVVLSWSFLFLACCVHYFVGKKIWPVLGVWGAVWLVCLNYPFVSGSTLERLYLGVTLGTLLVSWAVIAWGVVRTRKAASLPHLILILGACADGVLNIMPYVRGLVTSWPLARMVTVMLLSAWVAIHAIWLVRRRGTLREA
jgi:hypothetical protein